MSKIKSTLDIEAMQRGVELYEAILAADYTQRDVAEFVGVHESAVSRWIRGAHIPRKHRGALHAMLGWI